MYSPKLILILTIFIAVGSSASAELVTNGSFDNGYSGWNTDTDGLLGSPNDFSIIGGKARVEADYWVVPGDSASTPANDVFFANTLFQELNMTVGASDTLTLSFDWEFGGEAVSGSLANEYFLVGLNDGLGTYYGADGSEGFLINPTVSYGSGTFSAELDYATFANQSGWFLDFQIGVGVDPNTFLNDALGSYMEIDNVSLQTTAVPVPGAIIFYASALSLLFCKKKNRKQK